MNSLPESHPHTNPYPGPRPFELAERDFFFGREREALDLISLLIAHKNVLLFAQSGAGKTSLLNAKLIPRLEQRGISVLPPARVSGSIPTSQSGNLAANVYVLAVALSWLRDVSPEKLGSATISELLAAVPRRKDAEGEDVVRVAVFDQFEELFFTHPEKWDQRKQFMEQVAEALEADAVLRVLFIVREDYLASVDSIAEPLPERLRTRYHLEQLRRDAAIEAVTKPMERAGRRFAEGVAEALVDDLREVRTANAQSGTRIMGEFVEPVQLQVVCRDLFSKLPRTSVVITSADFNSSHGVDAALQLFYERTLKSVTEHTGVSYQRLQEWFETKLITSGGTRGFANEGHDAVDGIPKRAAQLLEDAHLVRAEVRAGSRWYELTHDRLIGPIRKANEGWREKTQAAAERRKLRKLYVTLGAVSTVLFIVSLLLLRVWAMRGEINAKEQAFLSEKASEDAMNELRFDPEVALLLAREAYSFASRQQDKPGVLDDAEATLEAVLPGAEQEFIYHALKVDTSGAGLNAVAISPDGSQLAAGGGDGRVHVFKLPAAGAPLQRELITLKAEGPIVGLAFGSNTKSLVISATTQDQLLLWIDPEQSARALRRLTLHAPCRAVAFSSTAKTLAIGCDDASIQIFDIEDSEVRSRRTFKAHRRAVLALEFSPDDTSLASSSEDNTVLVWNISDISLRPRIFLGHKSNVNAVDFSVDDSKGRYLASSDDDGIIRIFDRFDPTLDHMHQIVLSEQSPQQSLFDMFPRKLCSVKFTKNHVVAGASDGTLLIWRWPDPDPNHPTRLGNQQANIRSLDVSSDGRWIIAANSDGVLRLWEQPAFKREIELTGSSDSAVRLSFTRDSKNVIAISLSGELTKWNLNQDSHPQLMWGPTDSDFRVVPTAITNDQWFLVRGEGDVNHPKLKLYDLTKKTGILVEQLNDETILGLAFATDDSALLVGTDKKSATL
jgi:WD40 repeat protein